MRNFSQAEGKIKAIFATPWKDGMGRYYEKCVLIMQTQTGLLGLRMEVEMYAICTEHLRAYSPFCNHHKNNLYGIVA